MNARQTWKLAKLFFPPPPTPDRVDIAIEKALSDSGVYFMYQRGVCVYVGESIDVRKRLNSHEQLEGIDYVGVIYCDSCQRKRLECFYIGLLNPERNHQNTIRKNIKWIKIKINPSQATIRINKKGLNDELSKYPERKPTA
jgi:excinuclease UvrABC nuclease subunit